MDEAAAAANPFFDGRVAHGYLVVSLAAGLFVDPDPGPVLANYGLENLRFLTPVYPGDELTVTLTCKQINPREDAEYGEVRWDADVTKQDGSSVAKYDVLTLVARRGVMGTDRLPRCGARVQGGPSGTRTAGRLTDPRGAGAALRPDDRARPADRAAGLDARRLPRRR